MNKQELEKIKERDRLFKEKEDTKEIWRLALNDYNVQREIELAHNARGIFYHVQPDGTVKVEKRNIEKHDK